MRPAASGTDDIDILLLHRPDALVEPEEVAQAFDALHAAGKVRAFGVSNHTPAQIELLRRSVSRPLAADQVQLPSTHAPLVAHGAAPAGRVPHRAVPRLARVPRAQRRRRPARRAGRVPELAIATAWITRHPAGMQVRAEWCEPFRAAGCTVP